MKVVAGALVAVGLWTGTAHAQLLAGWRHAPTVAVISAIDSDARLDLVDEAVAYWNTTLEGLGSGFRLGSITRLTQPVPEDALQSLSRSILGGARGPGVVPQALQGLPGDLTVLLAESNFVSFCGPFDTGGRRVIGIRGARFPPLTVPKVALNVIAHELGHAIGLPHNSDPTRLMCGRPAPCQLDRFEHGSRVFPLTDDEKRRLLQLYPSGWKPEPR